VRYRLRSEEYIHTEEKDFTAEKQRYRVAEVVYNRQIFQIEKQGFGCMDTQAGQAVKTVRRRAFMDTVLLCRKH